MVITTAMILGVIAPILTASGMFAAFMFRQGRLDNEMKNMKEKQTEMKKDIYIAIEKKADKDVLEYILASIKESIEDNRQEHRIMMDKMDKIIESK